MSINKILLAMALGLALTACTNQQQADEAVAEAAEASVDAQAAADAAAASGDAAAADAAQAAADTAASAADAAAANVDAAAAGSGDAAAAAPAAAAADAPARAAATTGGVVGIARSKVGAAYVWGASGPGAFDCSGLTLGAWTSAGGRLPRTAQWQYTATARVAIADLQPGDLVFFGPNDRAIHHVGLYVGNGTMIEAPHTGAVIRYSSIYRRSLLPTGCRVG